MWPEKCPPQLRAAIFRAAGHRCQRCRRRGSLTLSHIVARGSGRSRGGPWAWHNLHALCRGCHLDWLELNPAQAEREAPTFGPNAGIPYRVAGRYLDDQYQGPHERYAAAAAAALHAARTA